MITYTHFDSPIGKMFIAKTSKGICRIGLPPEDLQQHLTWLQNHFYDEEISRSSENLSKEIGELKLYFQGKLKQFTFSLDLKITPFRKLVLEEVRKIPYGKTASYKDISERIRSPRAVRAVGGANANNPIPIVIPCHRVISHNGSLGGYGGGLKLKQKLLKLEGAL